jgi:ABC-type spermidine/putrescine transport system permease subunit II
MKSSSFLRLRRILINPLSIVQLIVVGVPLLWLFISSLREWKLAYPPTGFTFDAYIRLFSDSPARMAFINTLVFTAVSAMFAVGIGIMPALYATKRPRKGILLLSLLAATSFVATPIRAEGWRNLTILLKVQEVGWAAIPSMVAAAVPFASLLFFMGIRDLQRRDLQFAQIQGISLYQRFLRLRATPIAKTIIGTWLFSGIIILFDLGTPSELLRGSTYLLGDELRSRAGVQAWSHIAADASIMVICSGTTRRIFAVLPSGVMPSGLRSGKLESRTNFYYLRITDDSRIYT